MAALHAGALPPGWDASSIADLMETPGTSALVAVAGAMTGLVIARTAVDEAEILTLAVAVAARRYGIGRSLVDAAIGCVRAQGATRLHLEVASNNAGARKFYAVAGFLETGRRARYYPDGADALLLSRTLA